jgi:autotransporter passenger strand-loop-strand repeat protein
VRTGGVQYDFGAASGTTIDDGGVQDVYASATATIINAGGVQYVFGAASGTIINSGGLQDDYGSATSTVIASDGTEYVEVGATDSAATIDGGGLQYVFGTAISATIKSGGSEIINAGGTAIGTIVLSGGTLFASGGMVDVAEAIKGGSILIGDGTVDIQQASADNVTFQFGGIGGLELPVASAYTGKVSGFGGNSNQFIDFININSSGAIVSYASSTSSSGVLKVTSGGHTLASIHMVGHYTTADFTPGDDGSGHLEITDPPVVQQKSGNAPATIADGTVLEVKVSDSGEVTFAGPTGTLWLDHPSTFTGKVADFGAQESIDLPSIPFGIHATLGYSENSSDTGGILSVKEGTHIAKLALLGNYMATSFVAATDGHGGTLINEAAQTANQLVPLTTPHTG